MMIKKQKREKQSYTVDNIKEILESICPLGLQESWDNSGFQVKCSGTKVNRIMIALEVNQEIINEAIEQNVELIITHHPLLFSAIKKISTGNPFGIYLKLLMENNISVYSMHTNFDSMNGGNNDYFGELLGFEDIRLLDSNIGFCRKSYLNEEITIRELVNQVAIKLDIDSKAISIVGDLDRKVSKIAWCTGAGSDFIRNARIDNMEVFITGDVKYHRAQEAKEMGISVIDVGHYGSEKIFIDNAYALIEEKLNELDIEEIEILRSKIDIDPFIHI